MQALTQSPHSVPARQDFNELEATLKGEWIDTEFRPELREAGIYRQPVPVQQLTRLRNNRPLESLIEPRLINQSGGIRIE